MAGPAGADEAVAADAAGFELAADPDEPGLLRLRLLGAWTVHAPQPSAAEVFRAVGEASGAKRLAFDSAGLGDWDSGLLTFLIRLDRLIGESKIEADPAGLPDGAQRLLRLASAVPERKGARREGAAQPLLERLGKRTLQFWQSALEVVGFLGEVTIAFGRMLVGKARFRRSDFFLAMQQVGADALPIVSLISFLVGVILAFLGAIQLLQFGAQIYVADLVGIGMARDMAAMMVGIILAGRTGAAFAAELGSMQVNEEIDALSTFGFAPMEFLVLPRMLALMLMTPLLCLYADLLGILGGMTVGVSMLDLPAITYFQETEKAIPLHHFAGGLIKATVYGVVVAVAGCYQGMRCGRSSAAVGQATTSAVVTSIVFIILSMALLTVVYDVLGI